MLFLRILITCISLTSYLSCKNFFVIGDVCSDIRSSSPSLTRELQDTTTLITPTATKYSTSSFSSSSLSSSSSPTVKATTTSQTSPSSSTFTSTIIPSITDITTTTIATTTTTSTTTTIKEDLESLSLDIASRTFNLSRAGEPYPSASVKNSKVIVLKNETSQAEYPGAEFDSTEDKINSSLRSFSRSNFNPNETFTEYFADDVNSSSSFQYNDDTTSLGPVPETPSQRKIPSKVRKTVTEPPESLQKAFSQDSIKFASGDVYSPGRHHKILIDSPTPFDDFIFQIMGTEGNSEAYGDFISLAPYTTAITCNGSMSRNTLVDTKDPVKFQTLNITWRGPPEMNAPDQLKYKLKIVELPNSSVVIQGILKKTDLPPHNTSICGMRNHNVSNGETSRIVDVSCFRVCPAEFPNCPFPQSNYALIIIKEEKDLIITMGAITTPYYNYVAFGKTEDMETLKNSDLHICYRNDAFGADIRLAFMFLLNKTTIPEQQEGDLILNGTFMDQETLWCRFRRPFIGSNVSVMDVNSPFYFFFFVGHHEDGEFEIPEVNNMMMLDRRIKLEEEVFPSDVLKLRRSGTWSILPHKFYLCLLIFVSMKVSQ